MIRIFNFIFFVIFFFCSSIVHATETHTSNCECYRSIDPVQEDVEFVENLEKFIAKCQNVDELYELVLEALEAQERYLHESEVPVVLIERSKVKQGLWEKLEMVIREKGIISMEGVFWPGMEKEDTGFMFQLIKNNEETH